MRTSLLAVTAAALTAALASSACSSDPGPHAVTTLSSTWPAPTEHRLDQEAEGAEHKARRDAWFEELHSAAPGVLWRAIESENLARLRARRNQLGGTRSATPSGAWGGAASPGSGGAWREVGSANQAGRVLCAQIGPDGQKLYAGVALGGAWSANLDGSSWTPLADNLGGGVQEMVVLPGEAAGDPDVLVLASGASLWVSRDSGLTWESPAGLGSFSDIRVVSVLQGATPTVVVQAQRSTGNRVLVHTSTDYARTFTQSYVGSTNFAGSLWVPRLGPTAQTDAWLLDAGSLYHSTDGAQTFAFVRTIEAGASRGVLAGCESGSPSLYAALSVGGQWRLHASHDAGQSFDFTHTITDFWESLAASVLNPGLVIYGGVECWRSIDGGNAFSKVNGWSQYYGDPANKLHADIPGIHCWPDPANAGAEVWFVSTDGGLFESRDFGASWQNKSLQGLGISQYYSSHTSVNDPTLVVAGAQDQGYQRGFVQGAFGTGGGPQSTFAQLISGDYAQLTSGDGTHALLFSVYPGFVLIQDGEQAPQLHTANFPAGAPAPWLPVILGDPLDPTKFFFGSDVLYRYDESPANVWKPTQHSSQGFTAGGSYITGMAFAPSDSQRMVAVNTGGRIYVSDDHGVTWTQTSSGAPGDHYLYGQTVAIHPTNPDEIVVAGSGYSTAGVVRSLDGGQTWSPLTNGLPPTVVFDVTYAPDMTGDLYAATQTGAWRWVRTQSTWVDIMSNVAPITTYWSVEAVEPGIVRFATYGRGIWDYQIPEVGGYQMYGQGKLNSLGQLTLLDGIGQPSLTQDDFALAGFQGVPYKPGLVIWSTTSATIPFFGGTLLVQPPAVRDQLFQFDVFSSVVLPIPVESELAGTGRYYQLWYRDTQHPDGTGVGLSNGLQVQFGL